MKKQFSKYLNGTTNPQEFSAVLDAIYSDEYDGKVSLELLKLWEETLNSNIENKENSQLLDKIHHRIALEESRVEARRFNFYRNLFKYAAVFIFGLIISAIALYPPQIPTSTPVLQTITTPYGARTSFNLPDGSEVWLNSGSTISFPKDYSKIRDVELSGQAYFHIVKNEKPFVVKTNLGNIEVMGTSFDVKAYANDNLETTLVEGSVKVNDGSNQVITLRPGQQSVITPSKEHMVNDVNIGLITSWKEGKLIFEKEPFVNVAKALERWYNVKIELKGDRLKKLGYTGTIEMETFVEVLELINTTTPINYKFDKKARILKISER